MATTSIEWATDVWNPNDGWSTTRDSSGVRAWRGTRTAQNTRRHAAAAEGRAA